MLRLQPPGLGGENKPGEAPGVGTRPVENDVEDGTSGWNKSGGGSRASSLAVVWWLGVLLVLVAVGFLLVRFGPGLVAALRESSARPPARKPVDARDFVNPPTSMEMAALRTETAWKVVHGFAAGKEPGEWTKWMDEGEGMREKMFELGDKGHPLADGMPPASDFGALSREQTGIRGEDAFAFEALRQVKNEPADRFLVVVVSRDGRMLVAGRLFWEVAANRFAVLQNAAGDPGARYGLMVRVRRGIEGEAAYRIDPGDPVAEVSPPGRDQPFVRTQVAADSPLGRALRALGPSETINATLVFQKNGRKPDGVSIVEQKSLGWEGIDAVPFADAKIDPPWGEEAQAIKLAQASLQRFLTLAGEGHLGLVADGDGAKLVRECEIAFGRIQTADLPLRAHSLAHSLAKAGVVVFRLPVPPADGQGTSVAVMVPFAGDYKIDGMLLAQSHYGAFRRYAAQASAASAEMRGVVMRGEVPDGPDGTLGFRFRDPFSETAVDLTLPRNHQAAAALLKVAPGQPRHATLRLAWRQAQGEAQPKIVLDEWLCWGYRGIDDQAF